MLLNILARADALFWPCRTQNMEARRAIAELRDEYRELGLAWRVGGDSTARQAKLRELDALAEAGRLCATRTPGRQSVYVKLPDAVDNELRRQACLADYDAAVGLLGWIKSEIDAGGCYTLAGRAWVREPHLAGVEYGGPDVGRILGGYAECMLPLLVRGLADSNADCQGRVWYALTPEGEPLAEAMIEACRMPAISDPDDADARKTYLQSTQRERSWLEDRTPREPRGIGPIPMPEGV